MPINCGQIMKLEKKNLLPTIPGALSNEIEYFTLGLVSALIKIKKHFLVKI
jgi:hypothetical protein